MRARYVDVILCVVVAVFSTTQAFATKNILFIFDASGSMSAQMPEGTKIDIARRVLSERVQNLPDSGIDAGLVVYGHRRKGDCGDIEQRMKLKPLNKKALIESVQSIHPKGKTPIAASIRLAVDQLKELEDETTIILISDGQETCDADPCAVVQQLKDTGIKFVLHVIGFDVNKEERRQLECLAKAGGGEYVPAPTAGKLDEALRALTTPIVTAMVKVQENVEIILDTSVAMQKPFEGGTKLEAAVKALNKVLSFQVADRDNLAFRRYGGPCKGDNTELLVNFGQNNVKQIRDHLPSASKGDTTTTANAIVRAVSDFDDLQRFADVNRRVLIITGGRDMCDPQAADVIRQSLLKKKIRPTFWFIGMDVPPDQERQLIEIGRATDGKLFHVKNQNELENILERLFEVEPVIADINTMVDILN
jgi:Mg-chelatase subunit ChlD